ncbi:hypothetical protein KKA14_18860 [bacterium]|nr:hypothetical protein [bacterium]
MNKPNTSLPYFEPIARKPYLKKWVKHRRTFWDKPIDSNNSANRFDDWYEKGIETLEINNLELTYIFRYVIEAAGCEPFYNQISRLNKAFIHSNNKSYKLLEDLLNDIIIEAGLDFSFEILEPSLDEHIWVTEYIYEEEIIGSEPEIEPDFIRPAIVVPSIEKVPVYAKLRDPDSPDSLFARQKADDEKTEIEVESKPVKPDYIPVRLIPNPKSKDGTAEDEITSEDSGERYKKRLKKAVKYTDSIPDLTPLDIKVKGKLVPGGFSMSLKGMDQDSFSEELEADNNKLSEQISVFPSSLPAVERTAETELTDKETNEHYISERPIISIFEEEEISIPEEQKREQGKRGFYGFLSLKPEPGMLIKKDKKYASSEESTDPLLISHDCIERRIVNFEKQGHFLKGFSDTPNNLKNRLDKADVSETKEDSLLVDADSIKHRIDNVSKKAISPGGFALILKNKKQPTSEDKTDDGHDDEINIPKENSSFSGREPEAETLKNKKSLTIDTITKNDPEVETNIPSTEANSDLSRIETTICNPENKKSLLAKDTLPNNNGAEKRSSIGKANSILLRIEKKVDRWCKKKGIENIYSEVTELEKRIESIASSITSQEGISNTTGLIVRNDRGFTHDLLKLDEFLETVFFQDSDKGTKGKNNRKSKQLESQQGLMISKLLREWFHKRSRSKSSWNEIYENSLRSLKHNKGLLSEWLAKKVTNANSEKQEIRNWIRGQISSSGELIDIFEGVIEQTKTTDMAVIMKAVYQKIDKKDLPNQIVVDIFNRIKEESDLKPIEFKDLERILNERSVPRYYQITEKITSGYSISSYRNWKSFVESPDIKIRTSGFNKAPYLLVPKKSKKERTFLESPNIKVRTSNEYFNHYLGNNKGKPKNESSEIKAPSKDYSRTPHLVDFRKTIRKREFLDSPKITVRTSNDYVKRYTLIDKNKIIDWKESQCYTYFDEVKN